MPLWSQPNSDNQFEYVRELFGKYRILAEADKERLAKFRREFVGALSVSHCGDPRNPFLPHFNLPLGSCRIYRKPGGVLSNANAGFQRTYYRHKLDALDVSQDVTFLTQLHCDELGGGGCAHYAQNPRLALVDALHFTEDCDAFFSEHAPGRFFAHIINYVTTTGQVYIYDRQRERWINFLDLGGEKGVELVGDVFSRLPRAGRERLLVLARRHREFYFSDHRTAINTKNLSCVMISGWAEFALGSPYIFPNDPRCNELQTTTELVAKLTLRNLLGGRVSPFRRILFMTATPFHGDRRGGVSKSKSAAVLQARRMVEWKQRYVESVVNKEHHHLFDFVPAVVDMDRLELIRLDAPK